MGETQPMSARSRPVTNLAIEVKAEKREVKLKMPHRSDQMKLERPNLVVLPMETTDIVPIGLRSVSNLK